MTGTSKTSKRVLLVDLNNFARYPTMPIGYLARILRASDHDVSVFSPLSLGVQGVAREPRSGALTLATTKLNHRVAVSRYGWIRNLRDRIAAPRRSQLSAESDRVLREFGRRLQGEKPDVVLISSYLMYRDLCVAMCAAARRASVPVLLGGPYFAQMEVLTQWISIPGVTALVAGEIELEISRVVDTIIQGGSLSQFHGVFTLSKDGQLEGSVAPPLEDLDRVPFPDYSDFPWDLYPNRMVPVMTGRGCAWGACTFCSDVSSTSGRRFRSRSPQNVMAEIEHHYKENDVKNFVFTDLKLNGSLDVWRAILNGMQQVAPESKWIAAVHVGDDSNGGNGLSASELRAAAASGCVRLTTGLETGSQRVADLMRKGTAIDRTVRYLEAASAAGISCRCTMILGYPGEKAEDVAASAAFLREHAAHIGRISLNRFSIMTGTVFHRTLQKDPAHYPGLTQLQSNDAVAHVGHYYSEVSRRDYRKAMMGLLDAVHAINTRDLGSRAQDFEGAM